MRRLGIVRRLPPPLRRVTIGGINRLRYALGQEAPEDETDLRSLQLLGKLPRPSGMRAYAGQRVVVAGLFGSRCGLQRGAELMVLDLRARGVEVLAFDFTAALDIPANIEAVAGATADASEVAAFQPTDLIVHMNPPLFARVLTLFAARTLAGAAVVGYWAWELTVLPPAWRSCAAFADEIWTPSPFTADAASSGLPAFTGPVRVVPHAVHRDPMLPMPRTERAALRAGFGLAENRFVIGTSFSFASNYARKNPCAAIDAFRLAFRGGEPACLVIRCNDTAILPRLFEHLVSFAGDDGRVVVWDTARQVCPVRQFYGVIDLYVSLHRSEGYGLTLMEAAQAGVRVLATGWGLSPDIAARPEVRTVGSRLVVTLDSQRVYDRYPGAVWAEPDLAEAATELRQSFRAWSAQASQFEETLRQA